MQSELVQPTAFSCELNITDAIWEKVIERHQIFESLDSIMVFFDDDLQKLFTRRLQEINPNTDKNLKVACINWHYTSGERIQLMIDRGRLLKTGQLEKAAVLTEKIENLILTNSDGLDYPPWAFITFQTLDGLSSAFKAFGFTVQQPADDPYGGLIKLKTTPSPHATIWENRDVSKAYQWKAGILFALFYLFYIFLCIAVMVFVKTKMVSIRFNFVFLDQCKAIKDMFAERDDY